MNVFRTLLTEVALWFAIPFTLLGVWVTATGITRWLYSTSLPLLLSPA